MQSDENCPVCHGEGIVKEKDGTVHVCWRCLNSGTLDVHSKELRETNIKL